jgi:hypothetical protein
MLQLLILGLQTGVMAVRLYSKHNIIKTYAKEDLLSRTLDIGSSSSRGQLQASTW